MPATVRLQVLDKLLAALATIGPAGVVWRTTPLVAEGIPGDALPSPGQPGIYAHFVRTVPPDEAMGTSVHRWRTYYAIWMAAETMRGMVDVDEDVVLALGNSEGAVQQILGVQGWWYDDMSYEPELTKAGLFIGRRSIYVTHESTH